MRRRAAAAALLLLLAACTPSGGAPSGRGALPRGAPRSEPSPVPAGVVRVAYPQEPTAWLPAADGHVAATDLAALWGLPLYRVDPYGQLRPGLVADAEVTPGRLGSRFQVDLRLRAGAWSDGRPVVAADVVATVEALRATPAAAGFGPLEAVRAVGANRVRLVFARPYARWPYLLAGGLSVLPAHVLRRGGLAAYAGAVPVSAGPFRLARYDRALRAVFVAHRQSPLGRPAMERVEVYFTPDYETALGLLRDRRVDAVMGYLALNPVQRARLVEQVQAAAPLGGTMVMVRWDATGRLGGSRQRRHAVRQVLDMSELVEGLLGEHGELATATVPGTDGPWRGDAPGGPNLDGLALRLLVVGRHEATALTARVLQRDLRAAGAEVELVWVEPEDAVGRQADGELEVRRSLPLPAMVGEVPGLHRSVRAALAAAEAAGTPQSFARAQAALHASGLVQPLYRIGVAHAWHRALRGVRPSSWPGLAFWDVAGWHWEAGHTPPQKPTLTQP